MKSINKIIFGMLFLGLSACEKDLPVYETSVCQLNFVYGTQEGLQTDEVTDDMRMLSHSFILNSGEGVMVDTVWVRVRTMGYLADQDRPFELIQLPTDGNDAVAGTHYVAFDDPDLQSFYMIPAGQAEVLAPIVVLRDPSLEESGDVTLKFTFQENDYFKLGYPEFSTYSLVISDQLTKPSMWGSCSLDYYFGTYGAVKHELMIKWMDQSWDDAYIETLFEELYAGFWLPKDEAYLSYLGDWFAEKLQEENEERLADPEIGDVWREANGEPVDFTPLSY